MRFNIRSILTRKSSLLIMAVLMFIVSVLLQQFFSPNTGIKKDQQNIEANLHKQQQDFYKLMTDTVLLQKLVQRTETLEEFKEVQELSYGVYIYAEYFINDYQLVFWNNKLVIPEKQSFELPDGVYFQNLLNGDYVTVKRSIKLPGMSNRLMIFGMMPVKFQYYIETDYAHQTFAFSRDMAERIRIAEENELTDYPVKSLEGNVLFYLEKRITGNISPNDNLSMAFRLSALILLLMFIHYTAENIVKQKNNTWQGIAFLTGSLILIRLFIYLIPELFNLRQFELFDPTIYGSTKVFNSLGDLLINALLFCWIVVFAWSKLGNVNWEIKFKESTRWIIGLACLFLLILSTFVMAGIIRSLIADSRISFDVTNFFSLNIYSVISFAVLACLSLGYYYFTQLLFRFIFPVFEGRRILIYFAIAILGLLYISFLAPDNQVQFYVPVLLWFVVFTWLISQKGFVINRFRVNIAGILFWIFIFSFSISAIILTENKVKELQARKTMAEKIAMENDPANEKQISVALTYLDNDFLLANFDRFREERSNNELKDSIINFSYEDYRNRYRTRLYVYDENMDPLFNDDPTSYEALNNIVQVQARPTNVPDLFYYETAVDQFTYITRRQVTDIANNKFLGTFFIISTPKNYGSDVLSPELFRQMKQTDPESSPIYSTAIYNKQVLISPSNKYPFPIYLKDEEVPKSAFVQRVNGEYDELWYRGGNERIVIVARKSNSFIETITLFSYIFCAFLFMVTIFQLASMILKTLVERRSLKDIWQMNIRTQVHSTIIFISVLSFTIIGIATISFFISRFNRNNSEKLSRTMRIMVSQMEEQVARYPQLDDVVKMYDSLSNDDLQTTIEGVAQIHDVEVNLYDLNGNLVLTSTENIYRKGVLSPKMHPEAYYHLNRLRQIRHIQDEEVANLSYLSIYAPVRKKNGEAVAYLNIPYFTSLRDLNQEISNFLVTIINLNAFIFLIAGVIALFITNRITRSFSLISDKMREVNINQTNEEIEWPRKDEIGVLVKEYNKMVAKLEYSAQALAKSEREGAWREMAQQVAHEIKNPLTPMKLSIQYLQKAIDNNQDNVKDLASRVTDTLVEQIDHLSKIAADFAQFANIGNTKMERIDLHEVIDSLKDLYKTNPDISISWKPVQRNSMVMADRTQMNRLFTNLLSNAADACDGKDNCRIEITETRANGQVQINITDNGEGIPVDMQHKIFTPNFTTKSSGTGLGLAMCKSIVEQAHGHIWFETEQGKGTTFHVVLPVAN